MFREDKFLYTSIAGFLVGVALSSYIHLGLHFAMFLGVVASVVLFLYWLYGSEFSTENAMFIVFLIFFAVAVVRFDLATMELDENLEKLVDRKVTIIGEVAREPVGKDNYRQLVINIEKAEGGDAFGKVLVYAPFYPEVAYGDHLRIKAKLSKPGTFQTDRGGTFDFASFLEKDGIGYQMFYPSMEVLEKGRGNFLMVRLFRLKSAFLSRLERVIPEPHAALMGGILLGTEESLGQGLVDEFRQTGLIHIVVLSGYNVTIVAESIRAVFSRFLPFYASGFLGMLSIVLFALLVGPSATVLRASIMALIAVAARMSYRPYAVGRALFVAGALMVLWNPHILANDSSFQLSFVATLGLVYLSPLLEPYFRWVSEKLGLREIVLATASTQIAVLPMILYKMGIFSGVSLPVNVLVLPVVPVSMLFGFLTGLAGFVNEIVSLPFAYISYFLLEYMLRVVETFNSIPYSFVEIGIFSLWWIVTGYFLLGIFSYWLHGKQNPVSELEKLVAEIEIVEVQEGASNIR